MVSFSFTHKFELWPNPSTDNTNAHLFPLPTCTEVSDSTWTCSFFSMWFLWTWCWLLAMNRNGGGIGIYILTIYIYLNIDILVSSWVWQVFPHFFKMKCFLKYDIIIHLYTFIIKTCFIILWKCYYLTDALNNLTLIK